MGSLEYKAAHYDPANDMISPDRTGPKLYALWHEYLLVPLYLRGHSNTRLLVSRHRDAEILSRAAAHLGFELVRGSTNRHGITALRELLRQKQANIAITCDGPRGPRRELAAGAIFLASRLKLPVVAVGIGFDRPWRTRSWDRFAVPRPGTRTRIITSPAIQIPEQLHREQLEDCRHKVERLLNQLTAEAELWAESGTSKLDEVPTRRVAAAPLPRPQQRHIVEPAPVIRRKAA